MAEQPEPLTESELVEQLQEEMRRITVSDYLRHLLVSLSSMAFQRLGLTPESVDDRDLTQSRMAIDAFEALVDVLSPSLSKDEESMFHSALHEMRMGFVRASGVKEAAAADAEPRERAGSEETEVPESEDAAESGSGASESAEGGENDGEG
jgi:Domain of unknown function (DUF1844)